jgi:hypothetical protein
MSTATQMQENPPLNAPEGDQIVPVTTGEAGTAPHGVKLPIYMDYHATTPMDPRVLEAMIPFFTGKFGNAASRNHGFGWEAEQGVEHAREQVAKLINATAKEIIFTSGATESNNLAIKGIAEMYKERGNHIITQVTEHKAVLDTCKRLEKSGYKVTYLPVKADGLIDIEQLKAAMTDKTILVSIMFANNEIGVIQPVAEIGKLCHRWRAGSRQDPGRCPGAQYRRHERHRAQALRAKGCRHALCASSQPARADLRADQRRRPRARHAFRHAQRSRHRRLR